MLFKRLSIFTLAIILSCGYIPAAQANTSCEDEYSHAAFGSLEKADLDRLKKKYVEARRPIKNAARVPLYDYQVQGILGFSGQQTKTASNGRIEHRIWLDRDNCKRKVKASFRDRELIKIKSYGF